jgi:hypothetical protein
LSFAFPSAYGLLSYNLPRQRNFLGIGAWNLAESTWSCQTDSNRGKDNSRENYESPPLLFSAGATPMRSHSSARWLRYCDGHEIAARISARLAQRSNCGVEFLFTPLQENHLADLFRLSASEAAARIREGKLTSEALVRSCLERIDSRESQVKAWVHLNDDFALASSEE